MWQLKRIGLSPAINCKHCFNLYFIYYSITATELFFVIKHQRRAFEKALRGREKLGRTLRAITSFAMQLSKAGFSFGTKQEQLPMLKQGQLCSCLPPTWTTKALPHCWPSAAEDSLVGWNREKMVLKTKSQHMETKRKAFLGFSVDCLKLLI